jgi:hypothetical protein
MARAVASGLRLGIAACDKQTEKTDYGERT